jgi:hypothetical protein
MSDHPLPVDGQRDLLCRRQATLPTPPDIDNEGKKVYQAGGSYEIWTDVPLTPRVIVAGLSDDAPVSDSL